MRWLTWLKGRGSPDPAERLRNRFLPREWDEYFKGLMPGERHAASALLCRTVIATTSLPGEAVEQAVAALARGQVAPDLLEAIRSVVERLEGEYESLAGNNESGLSHDYPAVEDAFVKARAATALYSALRGDLRAMAYEAWFVVNDLDDVRRLVGMLQSGD